MRGRSEVAAFEERQSFDDDELPLIFSTALRAETAGDHAERYWIPLAMLTLGCRLNEIAQTKLRDFIEFQGISCLDINVGDPTQRLKNSSSARTIPLHPQLIQLGLMDYLEQRRRETKGDLNTQVFPALLYREQSGYVQRIGSWMNGQK